MLGSFVARWLGRERISSYGVRFTGKVRPGDALILRGRLARDGRCELEARRQADGEIVLTGWAVTS
jgi:hypothetical protein